MQDLVEQNLDIVARGMDCCLCERCRADITALALNNLPGKYVVTEEGEIFAKVSSFHQQAEIDVVAATMKAMMVVSKNPNHTNKYLDKQQ